MKRWLPLTLFFALLLLLGVGLTKNPRELPSALVGKPVPAFELPDLMHSQRTVDPQAFAGHVWVLNVWASWCVACQAEHQHFLDWQRPEHVLLVGLNYKDETRFARAWLDDMGGNPYDRIVEDRTGQLGIDLGVYGVPETFVINQQGQVVHRFTGALTAREMEEELIPLVQQLLAEDSSLQNKRS